MAEYTYNHFWNGVEITIQETVGRDRTALVVTGFLTEVQAKQYAEEWSNEWYYGYCGHAFSVEKVVRCSRFNSCD